MVEEIRKFLSRSMKLVDGLYSIIITDRDGVTLLKVTKENVPELALKPRFLATFGMAAEQAGKLGLKQNKSIITIHGTYQVISFNKSPLILTMIASEDANTGMILALEEEFDPVLHGLKSAVNIP